MCPSFRVSKNRQNLSFDNANVLETASLVRAESKENMPRGWAEIEVICTGGSSALIAVKPPSGSPDNPLSTKQLEDKFRDCAAHALQPTDAASVNQIISLIMEPKFMGDSRELIKLSVAAD